MKQVKNIICCDKKLGQVSLDKDSISIKKFHNIQMSSLSTKNKVVVNYICPICKKEQIRVLEVE